MSLEQRRNKGIALTISSVLGSLFAIAIMGLLYWLFLSRILEMHVAVDEATNELRAINLANLLISSEKIAYQRDGKIMRGILDAEKLDDLFVKKQEFLADAKALFRPKDIGIGYPNSLNLVRVVDLEDCDSNGCRGWIAFLSAPLSLEGLSIDKFLVCLGEHVKPDLGAVFRQSLWQPIDVEDCVKNTVPASFKFLFTTSEISSDGLPVLIRYKNGKLHVGKIAVWIGEWV